MKVSALTTLLFATGSMAAMGTEHRRARALERQNLKAIQSQRTGNPRIVSDAQTSGETHPQYDSNWAGAVLVESDFNMVTAVVNVPKPSKPPGGNANTAYYASAWVGIDGDTCQSAILQTGFDIGVQGGEYLYQAWYEWLPHNAINFNLKISAGDSIKMTVDASSKTSGKATIENLTTGKSVSHSFSGEGASLCETNAEWIVEDFESGSSLVPFADFGKFSFTSCSAGKTTGATVNTSGAQIVDIKQGGKALTSCSASGSDVTCSYTG